jgi:hypothetical protein
MSIVVDIIFTVAMIVCVGLVVRAVIDLTKE